ncbi:aminoacyl-tRNA hydrolase [Candidatus Roizmanbacteria bacterium CG11_big_fil_rev_8_21_14_0_20_36_8]|uniref:Peptidyl-tRNA hydrolase n=2 Tax=Candidatus Roizmaniibacteriota TaxID=1752723 RepID=A0A2M6ITY4_9BACT|nr:MAG: aminoacyl-tRNA hydrolase [Candidatus Roizmanbacteria bacterium CG11_big_fil_rev_8_21_14_0_20_36_8]PIZ66354.1 MAG: aminoacyl-tRNA hydrolase [Candidatus Roizmanbacteria bacterium CG_4_10_14_0_2_um_filter_36_9]
MKLAFIGLGNPGEKYQKNRHNVGFMFLDYLNKGKIKFKFDKYLESEIAKIDLPTTNNQKLATILAKPQTFMNRSGRALSKIMRNTYLPPKNVFVIHDDLDMRIGQFKIQLGIGPKVHNGLASIAASIKTKEFFRIRIGVDNRLHVSDVPGEEYVLENFTENERKSIESIFPQIFEKLQIIVRNLE